MIEHSSMHRARKKLSRQTLMGLMVGIPIFILLLMLINGYQVGNGMIMTITTIGLFVTTLRKKNFGIRFTRASFIAFAATFLTIGSLVENPALWPSQMYREMFKSTLIQPTSNKITELNTAFKWWLDNYHNDIDNSLTYYGNNITDVSKPLEDSYYKTYPVYVSHSNLSLAHFSLPGYYTEFQKLAIVDYFIKNMIIDWTPDTVVFHVTDYIPTPDEVLSHWSFSQAWKANPTNISLQAYDNCKGIAVVTVSFLRLLQDQGNITGHAYLVTGASHMFTAVMINGSTPFVFLNHLDVSIHVYAIYMDDNIPLYGQNLISTLKDTIIVDDTVLPQYHQYLDYLMYHLFGIVIVAAILIGILASMLFGYPRDYDTESEKKRVQAVMARWEHSPNIIRAFAWLFVAKIGNIFSRRHLFFWLNALLVAGLFVLGISILYFNIISTPLFPYATIFMYAFIFGMLFVLDRDFITRGFKLVYKAIKKTDFKLYR